MYIYVYIYIDLKCLYLIVVELEIYIQSYTDSNLSPVLESSNFPDCFSADRRLLKLDTESCLKRDEQAETNKTKTRKGTSSPVCSCLHEIIIGQAHLRSWRQDLHKLSVDMHQQQNWATNAAFTWMYQCINSVLGRVCLSLHCRLIVRCHMVNQPSLRRGRSNLCNTVAGSLGHDTNRTKSTQLIRHSTRHYTPRNALTWNWSYASFHRWSARTSLSKCVLLEHVQSPNTFFRSCLPQCLLLFFLSVGSMGTNLLGTQHWKEKPSSPQPQPKSRSHKWKHDHCRSTWQKLQAAAWNRLRSSSVWKPEFDASGTSWEPWKTTKKHAKWWKTVENPQTLSFISANFFELSSWRWGTIWWCARIDFSLKHKILNICH